MGRRGAACQEARFLKARFPRFFAAIHNSPTQTLKRPIDLKTLIGDHENGQENQKCHAAGVVDVLIKGDQSIRSLIRNIGGTGTSATVNLPVVGDVSIPLTGLLPQDSLSVFTGTDLDIFGDGDVEDALERAQEICKDYIIDQALKSSAVRNFCGRCSKTVRTGPRHYDCVSARCTPSIELAGPSGCKTVSTVRGEVAAVVLLLREGTRRIKVTCDCPLGWLFSGGGPIWQNL